MISGRPIGGGDNEAGNSGNTKAAASSAIAAKDFINSILQLLQAGGGRSLRQAAVTALLRMAGPYDDGGMDPLAHISSAACFINILHRMFVLIFPEVYSPFDSVGYAMVDEDLLRINHNACGT